MPARKNRPGKHGTKNRATYIVEPLSGDELVLFNKFKQWEREKPRAHHYVGWPDMAAAKALEKRGLIEEGGMALGCFLVTDLFREQST